MNRRDEIFKAIRDVPNLPPTAIEVLRLARDPDVDFSVLAQAIEHDPSLSANILRAANSAFFAGNSNVISVKNAIVRMGSRVIMQMVLTAAVGPIAVREVKGYELGKGALWEHSIATAIGAVALSGEKDRSKASLEFITGLLHDIGKLVMGVYLEIDFKSIEKIAFEDGISFESAEREILGTDHAEVGAELLDFWNIPEEIHQIVRYHHEPDKCENNIDVADRVHIADILCLSSGIVAGTDGLNYRISENSLARLGFEESKYERVVSSMIESLDEARSIFSPV